MNLLPVFQFGALTLTDYPFSVLFGSDRGAPEQAVADVRSQLQDGSLSTVTGYDNRTVTMQVLVEGSDLLDLAQNEALLVREAMKDRNEFSFDLGDGFAPASVYDTFEADLSMDYDDNRESHLLRIYNLTFSAYPWPRSAAKITTPAMGTGAATVLVDNADSTANWSTSFGTVSDIGVAVRASSPATDFSYATLTRTGSVDLTVTPYVAVDWVASGNLYADGDLSLTTGGGTVASRVSEVALPTGGRRTLFYVGTVVGDLRFDAGPFDGSGDFDVFNVDRTDEVPILGTSRQTVRSIQPGGSVATEGDVLVQHPSGGLGVVVVFSHPSRGGYSPPLRRWKVAGPTATQASGNVSGFESAINATSTIFEIPQASVPLGDTIIWALLRRTSGVGTVRINMAVLGIQGLVTIADNSSLYADVNFTNNNWAMVPLLRTTLPPVRLGAAGRVQIHMSDATASNIIIDEAWAFGLDEGCLSIVDCGTGSPASGGVSNRLKVEAPSPSLPNGGIQLATLADFSDGYTPPPAKVLCDQTGHRFNPDGSQVFTVTSGVLGAATSLEHYPRWHTNAAS